MKDTLFSIKAHKNLKYKLIRMVTRYHHSQNLILMLHDSVKSTVEIQNHRANGSFIKVKIQIGSSVSNEQIGS